MNPIFATGEEIASTQGITGDVAVIPHLKKKEPAMAITVYSKPHCPQCEATYRALDKQGATYSKVDVTQDAAALELIKGMGYQQAPVVITDDDHWSGFRPDRIKRAAAAAAAAAPLAAVGQN